MNSTLRIRISLLLLLLIANSLYAATPVETLDSYFKHLQTRFSQLADDNIAAPGRLSIRTELVNGEQFWLPVKGKPGRAFNTISFFQRKAPSSWEYYSLESNREKASIAVHFNVASFPGYPWKTRFEMINRNDQWLILSFKDLTRRPVPPESDIEAVLEHFLSAVAKTTSRIYSGELTREEKQNLNMEYGFGAGYWVGQTARKDLPAGSLYSYLLAQRKFSWEIDPARIAGDYGEAIVHIHSKPKYAEPVKKTYTIELSRLDNEWFLTNHRTKKAPVSARKTVKKADPGGSAPSDVVLQQLQLLKIKGARLTDLADASKPLWVKTRQARQGMGRLFGMALGANGGELPKWDIVNTDELGNRQHIMVRAIWADQKAPRLFHRIKFSLTNTEDGWRLSDAQLLRN